MVPAGGSILWLILRLLADGKSFTAFNSWIPGGRIDAYRWTWPVGGSAGAVVSVKVGRSSEKDAFDRFVLATPSDVAATGRICLTHRRHPNVARRN